MIRTYLHFEIDDGGAERLVSLFRHHQILENSVAQQGCHSAELTLSSDGSRAIVTATWDDPDAYARWTGRHDRGDLAGEISKLLTVPIDSNTTGRQYRIAHMATPSHHSPPQQEEMRP
jgi:quinol monooxygenase YgiN